MAKSSRKKLIALVGRPNVGKSTMFNLLTRTRKALVEDTPGLTRDRNYADVTLRDKSFTVVDTGGFEPTSDDIMLSQMRTQTMVAIEQADVIVFMGDGKVGVTPSDHEIVRALQQTDKKVLYAVNKVDSEKQENLFADFCALGVDPIYPVSAMTGYGADELIEAVLADIPEDVSAETETAPEPPLKVAVVGRPNVGKSTFINLLLGEERLVANPEPGTTRDSIDTIVRSHGKEYLFIDTAGIRRRSRIVDRVEKYSVIKAFRSIDRADIVLVLMDSTEGVTDQDARIAGYAFERGRGVILLLNKWDKVQKDSNTITGYFDHVRNSLKYLQYAPILTISALTGTRALKIFGLINELEAQYKKRVGTGELNRFLEDALVGHPPGMHRSKPIKIYYLTQIRTAPPTFVFFCNFPESIHFSYKRFMENRLREGFNFGGSPLKLIFKKKPGSRSYSDYGKKPRK
ncbi:MAG: ribosome biogenesis GTPase Der [Desulfomonile tiedjei]|uniref:GTPase Der n=1 Tax=Desulfomonile tiedjei TaxID=2358 RepID=A0A9D6Z0V5_9BACT|nr:ribosome biogenesis GTPase Der [Desulfomonile tiedjei]